MVIPILPDGLKPDDFWVIEVRGVEALYIVQELAKPVVDKIASVFHPVLITMEEDSDMQTYYFRKVYFSIESIVKATGLQADKVATAPVIKLHVAERPDLPKPNVNYWGKA